ncbi:efflux RND transporter periplasmic adaptor subunit [Roseibium sp.]|uniref:efflux RND transporter periplasmic adaptor subunit n=1 Tax=Roseibium sp. TaxID=1936156 RepID=UPI003A986346
MPDQADKSIEDVLNLKTTPGSRFRKSATWLIALAALGGGAGYYLLGLGQQADGLSYTTSPATKADITVLVTATGTIEPTNQVEISSELSGIIREVKVDYNSRVKTGETLAILDMDKLRASVESARAKLNAAHARVTEAEATVVEKDEDYKRKVALEERKIISVQELHTALASYNRALAALESAKADVTAAEADLRLHETNLDKACICSPIDGVVLSRDVDPGQVVAASLQAPVLFTIAEDLSQMEVQVDVDEADVGQVREGQRASFTVDAYPERTFDATIKALHFGSEIVQGVVTYQAVLSTDNTDLLLRPGMTATAEIKVQEEKAVLTIPNEALRYTPPKSGASSSNASFLEKLLPRPPQFEAASKPQPSGKKRRIWVLREGVAQTVDVTIGITDGSRTEVKTGEIAPGDKIIVEAKKAG